MKFLALETEAPGTSAADFEPHLRAEALRAWELQQQGAIREIYFRPDRHTAILVLECGDLGEAERVLASLPLAARGLICFEVIPLAPYDGFARLFAPR